MRAERVYAYGAAAGLLGDLLLGDPRRGHPVALFGRAAGAVERVLWRDDRGRGVLHTAVCAGGAAALGAATARAVRRSPAASVALTAAATWAVVGGTSLAREARAIGRALEAGDVEAARARLPHLCGRDPEALDADGIARAVVESVAENTSDAVVGALVWGAAGGTAGLLGFRAANTLDAMVGHRSPRYLRYGWASARLDDLAGWPGARLTALLAVAAGGDPRGALRAWRTDAHRHPSPNAGPVEASFAGALGVRLGGTLSYGGRVEHRPVLNGAAGRAVRAGDVERAVRLSRRVSWLALGVCAGARLLLARRGAGEGAPRDPGRAPKGAGGSLARGTAGTLARAMTGALTGGAAAPLTGRTARIPGTPRALGSPADTLGADVPPCRGSAAQVLTVTGRALARGTDRAPGAAMTPPDPGAGRHRTDATGPLARTTAMPPDPTGASLGTDTRRTPTTAATVPVPSTVGTPGVAVTPPGPGAGRRAAGAVALPAPAAGNAPGATRTTPGTGTPRCLTEAAALLARAAVGAPGAFARPAGRRKGLFGAVRKGRTS